MCSVPVVSLKTTVDMSGFDVRNISDRRTQFVLVWRKIWFVNLARVKHVLFILVFVIV